MGYVAAAFLGFYIFCLKIIDFIKWTFFEKTPYNPINTYHINKFFELSSLIEMVALSDVLDIVAPYNVIDIP